MENAVLDYSLYVNVKSFLARKSRAHNSRIEFTPVSAAVCVCMVCAAHITAQVLCARSQKDSACVSVWGYIIVFHVCER